MKKIISTTILLGLCSLMFSVPSIISVYETEKVPTEPVYSPIGITEELQNVMDNSDETKLIPVDIWITAIDIDSIEKAVKEEIGYNKADISAPYDRSSFDEEIVGEYSAEEVDEYIETERMLYAQEQKEASDLFIAENSEIQNLGKSVADKTAFVSNYAPLIRTELTKQEINEIADNEKVEVIYYSPEVELVDESNISIPTIRANYTRDTQGLTGSGVKIGQIEPGGLPNKLASYYNSANITIQPGGVVSSHADKVAAIMVSQGTYKGIVPNAQLYSAYYASGNTSDWRSNVEWLISQGVNVINMSAGISTQPAGEYGTQEKWVDHIAINHSMHFVKSSGNVTSDFTDDVTCPGMAYNVITVGAIEDNNTTSYTDDLFAWYSKYDEVSSTATNKPDLVAPGTDILTSSPDDPSLLAEDKVGARTGTSFSAPHVTAVVAQLCQKTPALKTKQAAVKSIITAGVKHSMFSYDSNDGTNFDKFGAGCVDAQGAYYIANHARYIATNFLANTAAGTVRNYPLTVSSSDTVIRVSLNWLKYSTLSGTHASSTPTLGTLPDLDLTVYDKNNNVVEVAQSMHNNTEIVKFTPSTSLSPYRIEVKQFGTSDRTVYYAVSWF
ncbi:MAG: S8 family serine peptidase [Ruminococcus sp.]|nr:S8 family serine peptidase [Ruminococcus sp.]